MLVLEHIFYTSVRHERSIFLNVFFFLRHFVNIFRYIIQPWLYMEIFSPSNDDYNIDTLAEEVWCVATTLILYQWHYSFRVMQSSIFRQHYIKDNHFYYHYISVIGPQSRGNCKNIYSCAHFTKFTALNCHTTQKGIKMIIFRPLENVMPINMRAIMNRNGCFFSRYNDWILDQ